MPYLVTQVFLYLLYSLAGYKSLKNLPYLFFYLLHSALHMIKVQQMYITSVDKDVRTIKAFVGNNSTFVQLLIDKT